MRELPTFLLTAFFFGFCLHIPIFSQQKPNVILVLTDDQGIGDLGAHGNPWLKTPNIDAFYEDAVRLTNFHVSPLCTPTRAAIITGRYPINNGAWATFKGRDALSNTNTIADIFKKSGYATALFGKWHLGDNYPNRPTDSGFDMAIHHLSGGIGELSDYWGNDYFDDVYYVNNQPKQFKGYCTDVWFDEAMKFMDSTTNQPFFVYLPLNAPHDPLFVDEKYASPYKNLEGTEIIDANLYGMIANIDENFGKLLRFLENKKLKNNTIVIFMSDNGTRFGYNRDSKLGFNKGFEGIKGSKLEGGHRAPFFIRWPKGKIEGGRDNNTLAAHIDVLPTLASLCGILIDDVMAIDGVDFSSILKKPSLHMPKRTLFLHNRQDWRPPDRAEDVCILQDEWRLLNQKELYDIAKDPKQEQNLASLYPDKVLELLAAHQVFMKGAKENPEYRELPSAVIGSPEQKEIKLTIQHAIGEDLGIWKTEQVAAGVKNLNNTYSLEIIEAGTYRISCRRWPKEIEGTIKGFPKNLTDTTLSYLPISPDKVCIRIANQILEKEIDVNDIAIDFDVELHNGKTLLTTEFLESDKNYGVYYTYINRLED